MIFQSLVELYDRLAKSNEVPAYGFSVEDIGFVITIDKSGNLIGQPEDLRKMIKANKFDFRQSVVPYTNHVNVRANAAATTPNFMVDKAEYLFGMSAKSSTDVHHKSFSGLIDEVCEGSRDEGVLAVKAFLEKWEPSDSLELDHWKEMSGIYGKWIAFRLQGDTSFVHEREEPKKLWSDFVAKKTFSRGVSFLDGEVHDLQSQYAQFKFGSGASLVSFNEVAYESYGKNRGENAPISVEGEFSSSTALKFLFRNRKHRLQVGDTTTVFWTEKASPVETFMGHILNPSFADQADTVKIQKFLEAVSRGILPNEIKNDVDFKFYILGVSLNKARLALRFWHVCSVDELMARLRDHFNNLEITSNFESDIRFPGIWHLLKETARETKDISPVLGGALTRSILTGAHYPQHLYQGVMNRIRADQSISYLRVSILKAVLQRNYKKEVPMSLNPERKDIPYLLGRLFAVLEKAQLDALGKVNATIKDRFFSSASATPASVFPRLLRLSQHHIGKAEYGYVSDRRISELMEHINAFPTHLNLQDQGLFAIAYYQQKNVLYAKNENKNEKGEE